MKKIAVLLLLFISTYASANIFRHKYIKNEKYRIITEVQEKVLLNGSFLNISKILNKVSIKTVQTTPDSGQLDCNFQLSEQFQRHFKSYALKSTYHAVFWRNGQGTYTIDRNLFMPVLRNIPSFPDKPIHIGENWSAAGEEVHDLRKSYNISQPFHFPVQVNYTYLRDENTDNIDCAVFKIEYTTFHTVTVPAKTVTPVPVKITGLSKKIYYWNKKEGKLHKYTESFDYIFHLSNGTFIEYIGKANGWLVKSPDMDKKELASEIDTQIKEKKLQDTKISRNNKGVTIILENIQFAPYSHLLQENEKNKLNIIAEILKKYKHRDLLITGHTAKVGPEKTSEQLSLRRAQSVADYLIKKKSIRKNQVILKGYGSKRPIADYNTATGKKRNRRVEITILEN